tara:strand:- start:656 stop:1378 length:723 start_codon:yes stop_codon:yes gene_type:complete
VNTTSKTVKEKKKRQISLNLQNIYFAWTKDKFSLKNCCLNIDRPGLWMLLGDNGCGKSTLLKLINGINQPQSGNLSCNFKTFLMFQNPDHQLLMPTCLSDLLLSVDVNINLEKKLSLISEALQKVGLNNMHNRPIHTLSGGQKQRLALAGALVSNAKILLLDEPTAFLDPISQNSILELIKELTQDPHNPIIALWITHRLEEVAFADGFAIMRNGQIGTWLSDKDITSELELVELLQERI